MTSGQASQKPIPVPSANIYFQKIEQAREICAEIADKIGFISIEPIEDTVEENPSMCSDLETKLDNLIWKLEYISKNIRV